MQYEYKTVVIDVPRKFGLWTNEPDLGLLDAINSKLEDLGNEGWQLVGVFPVTDGGSPAQISKAIHYFSRPKGAN